jgi:hypothetical protein
MVMRQVFADPDLVACCGLYCGACDAYLKEKCPGCRKSQKNGWCGIKLCAADKGIASCADCLQFKDPRDCGKFNNFISKVMGLVFNSDRPACIGELKQLGPKAYAAKMAWLSQRTIPRS